LTGKEPVEPRWGTFGRHYLLRVVVHILAVYALWGAILFYDEVSRSGDVFISSERLHSLITIWNRFVFELNSVLWSGLLSLACIGWSWASAGASVHLAISVLFCLLAAGATGLMARFAVPERVSEWIVWAGPQSSRNFQLLLIIVLLLTSVIVLFRRMTFQYERLTADRLALSPVAEDHAIRALVQSTVLLFITVFGSLSSWNISNARPIPAVAAADMREQKPSVLLFAVDSESYSSQIRKYLGEPFFKSWVVFGSPRIEDKFDEILQCRYPIRLIGTNESLRDDASGEAGDFFVTSALSGVGYSVSLSHEGAAADTSHSLKILSRSYAHVRLFRKFGLLLPSRVFYTPDVQLAQVREALSGAVGRGKAAFVTASLLSRGGHKQSPQDLSQFDVFLSALSRQNWLQNVMVVVLEFPKSAASGPFNELSLAATSAQVTFWASGVLADSSINPPIPKLVRGIDLGASVAARLRLSSVLSQCDGTALFDISERPSVFPRDLVYQELDEPSGKDIFRRRGWLTSDGYRLEVNESQQGAVLRTFKLSLRSVGSHRPQEPVDEVLVDDPLVSAELNRQLDDFLRTTGVEILNLGQGKMAYSEPFRRLRLLK
jgi:hypothetical protein